MRNTGTDDPTRWDWELAQQDEDARLLALARFGLRDDEHEDDKEEETTPCTT